VIGASNLCCNLANFVLVELGFNSLTITKLFWILFKSTKLFWILFKLVLLLES
jgi:hypothetical protein